jgi:RNA polymerase sigma-70 factor (ECF subfamily)
VKQASGRVPRPYRRELLTHCYRMAGSVQDAGDLVQETLLRGWRAYGQYDERRASLRTWLYRIATNACLTALRGRERRPLPSGLGLPGQDPWGPLRPGGEIPWLQPIPDDPADVLAVRGDLQLAFVAALQFLPARQRAIPILRDVLDFPARDVTATLQTTTTAVRSGLRRTRERLAGMTTDQLDEPAGQKERAEEYVRAFEAADLDALTRLLTGDVILEMPPLLTWSRGWHGYTAFIQRAWAMRGTDWRMAGAGANGQPAAAAYVREPHHDQHRLHALHLFTVTPSGIARTSIFQQETVFGAFALPRTL